MSDVPMALDAFPGSFGWVGEDTNIATPFEGLADSLIRAGSQRTLNRKHNAYHTEQRMKQACMARP